MKAVVCTEFGPADALSVQECPIPDFDPTEVLIEVGAAAVNFPDNLTIRGEYQAPLTPPFVPGFEVAGTVRDTGAAVTRFAADDRVMALTKHASGGYAEFAVATGAATQLIPEGMDDATATAFYSSYATSYHALVQRGRLVKGENLLVFGAGGGVGLASIELGRALGARVIGVAGSPDRLRAVREHGAHDVIDRRSADLREALSTLTDGRGVDVCVDTVGGVAFEVASRAMARNGRLVVVGFASGMIPALSANLPLLKEYSLVGAFWNNFVAAEPGVNQDNARHLAELYQSGALAPVVSKRFPPSRVAEALSSVGYSTVVGKLVITMRDNWA